MTSPHFHFILLAIGAVLQSEKTVTSLKIQNLICKEDLFPINIRIPLDECSLGITLMEQFGYIVKTTVEGEYERAVSPVS